MRKQNQNSQQLSVPNQLLPGKDAPLEQTISRAQEFLQEMDVELQHGPCLNPAPGCYSIHLQSKRCPQLYVNGKGGSPEAALASGYGEFFERLETNYLFSDYLLEENGDAPFLCYPDEVWFSADESDESIAIPIRNESGHALLNDQLLSFYNPDEELSASEFVDNNSSNDRDGICALPFKELLSGQITYFPLSILNNLYVSNGMAAGNSLEEASAQALGEVIERFVKRDVIAKGIALPDIPRETLKSYPGICSIIDELHANHFDVRLKDCSLGGQYPVICGLLADQENGGVFAAFGASLRFGTALERTLTEMLQGRNLKQLRDFSPPSYQPDQVADPFNLEAHFIDSDGLLSWQMFRQSADYAFTPWNFQGSTREEFHHLVEIIRKTGASIYWNSYGAGHFSCCRFIVPGMSEIYPIDDLLYSNRNRGNELRSILLQPEKLTDDDCADLINYLEESGLSDHTRLGQILGVTFDDGSNWASLTVGELKFLTLLTMHRLDEALFWGQWCRETGEIPKKRQKFLRLLESIAGITAAGNDISDFIQPLELFHSSEDIHFAQQAIHGKIRFPGLCGSNSWSEISSGHRQLLKLYQEQLERRAKQYQKRLY